jgi:inhibitor of the pro-sigma K processing machinery
MVFSSQIKVILKLLFNAGVGAVILYLSSIVMVPLGISVGINIFTLVISAFLGIPGVITLFAIQAIL